MPHPTPSNLHAGAPPNAPTNAAGSCLNCGYSLYNLPTWRCPECGYLNHPREQAAIRLYLCNTNPFVLKCMLIPLGFFISNHIVLAIIDLAARGTIFHVEGLLFYSPCFTLVYAVFVPYTLVMAAARLTQVQIIRRPTPSALSAEPNRAVPLFLGHLCWLSVIPVSIIITMLRLTT